MLITFNKLDSSAKVTASNNIFTLYANESEFDWYGNICYKTGVSVSIPKGYIGVIYPTNNIEIKDLTFVNGSKLITNEDTEEIVLKFKPTACYIDDKPKNEKLWKSTSDRIIIPQLYDTDITHNKFDIGDAIGTLVVLQRPDSIGYTIN